MGVTDANAISLCLQRDKIDGPIPASILSCMVRKFHPGLANISGRDVILATVKIWSVLFVVSSRVRAERTISSEDAIEAYESDYEGMTWRMPFRGPGVQPSPATL